jgi:hypothetical protein
MTDQIRKGSLTIADLEAIQAFNQCRFGVDFDKYLESIAIFHDICQDVEAEDEIPLLKQGVVGRRSSTPFSSFSVDKIPNQTIRRARRHSTFNPRNRKEHHDAHANMKAFLITMNDVDYERRSSFVNKLMELNLSCSVAMSASKKEVSFSMNLPYPVFSYLNENDEDSVEKRMNKRPSLVYLSEAKETNDWETLDDTCSTDMYCMEYSIEMPQIDEEVHSFKRKDRKQHSYKMFERKLSSESAFSVIKSFILEDKMKFLQSAALPKCAKDLEGYNTGSFPLHSVQTPVMIRQQCAREA